MRRPDSLFEMSDATPIYVQLIMLFRQHIGTGKWEVGDRIPVLNDLARQFGVARATVRQALGFLEREGLIARSRGRGTYVLRKPAGELWFDVPHSWEQLAQQSDEIEADWIDIEAPIRVPDPSLASKATLAPQYHVVRRVLRRDGVPYLIGTSFIDQRIADRVGPEKLSGPSLYRVLERARLRIARADQSVHFGTADAEIAYYLEVPLNAPIAIVRRWAVDGRRTLVYQSEGLFRGDFVQIRRRLI
jgi:GntR family transcriptional regulator